MEPPRHGRRTGVLFLLLVLVACTRTSPPANPGGSRSSAGSTGSGTGQDRIAGWKSDLDQVIPRMQAIHPDLYHGTSKASLEQAVQELESEVRAANDDQVMVGLLKIVARVSAQGRDGHTGAFIWGAAHLRSPVHSLPLRLWLFDDGLFVVDALPPYASLVGKRVVTIAGRPTGDVLSAVDPLIPRDNDSTVTLLMPRYLLIPEVLHGLGMIDEVGPVTFGLSA
jgi:hypothetical protein